MPYLLVVRTACLLATYLPQRVQQTAQPTKCILSAYQVTVLVNLWAGHKPGGVAEMPPDLVSTV